MRRVALIPARGGSKRLPRKNILPFLGKPMLQYSIEVALDSQKFDAVVVSTEDDEIADIARSCGAIVSNRNSSLAGDTNTVVEVCVDFLKKEAQKDILWDQLVILYACAPMRLVDDIVGVLSVLEKENCDVVMGVTEYSHYVHQALRYDSNGYAKPVFPELITAPRNEVPDTHVSSGNIYAVKCAQFIENPTLYPERLKTYLIPPERSIDIDTYNDYLVAQAVAENLINKVDQ